MSNQIKSLDALTGLRFIAAFAVFVHHIAGKFGFSHSQWPLGAQAVSFFFVLSGFILTYVYHDRLTTSSIKKFYFTRWARIWPLHIVCLLLSLSLAFKYWVQLPDFWGKFLTTSFLVQSWIPDTSWSFAINGVSWSISTEMFFYLMFPLFLVGGQKKFWIKYTCLLAGTLILVPTITWFSHFDSLAHIDFYRMAHTNPLLRLPEFCTGMAIGWIYLNRSKLESRYLNRSIWTDSIAEIGCLGMIVGYQWLIRHFYVVAQLRNAEWGGPFVGGWFNFSCGCLFFAVIIYVFSRSQGVISRLVSTKPMVFLGEVSFAFYMIHQFVIRAVLNYSKYYGDLSPWLIATCVGAISLALSILLYKLIEIPTKSALLKLYDGKFKDAVMIPFRSGFQFAKTRHGFVVLLLLIVPMVTLKNYRYTAAATTGVEEIVQSTDPSQRNIQFGDAMILLGCEAVPRRGGIEFHLAWEKCGEVKRNRYIQILDREGNVVAHGPRERELFERAKTGERFVDTFLLVNKTIDKGCTVGIGFHGAGIGMAKVNKGNRTNKNRRLELLSRDEYLRLAEIREEKFGVRVTGNSETISR